MRFIVRHDAAATERNLKMNSTCITRFGITTGAILGSLVTGVALGENDQSSASRETTDFESRIESIKRELASIRAEQESDWLTNAQRESIRALAEDVINDTNHRTSLLDDGESGTAGFDEHGVYFRSADGAFNMRARFDIAFRANWNNRDDSGVGGDDNKFGFENNRTRVTLKGDAFDEDFSFNLSGSFSQSSGGMDLSNAYVKHKFGNGWSVRWGQMKTPFLQEDVIAGRHQQTVGRSYVHALTTLGRTQGAAIKYRAGKIRATFMMNDGAVIREDGLNDGNANTSWEDSNVEWGLSSRVEYIVKGDDFRQFAKYSSDAEEDFGWVVGGAIHAQADEYGTASAYKDSYLQWTLDTQLKFGGANIAAVVVGLHTDAGDPSADDRDQFGFTLQGGFHLDPDKVEVFGRWEYFDFDDAVSTKDEEINLFTAGVNVFHQGQNRKWTTDVVYAPDRLPFAASNIGLRADSADGDGQIAIRSQYWISF